FIIWQLEKYQISIFFIRAKRRVIDGWTRKRYEMMEEKKKTTTVTEFLKPKLPYDLNLKELDLGMDMASLHIFEKQGKGNMYTPWWRSKEKETHTPLKSRDETYQQLLQNHM
ncbi:hypothetical protein ACJX0J_036348, partial [Zea mays]